MKGRMETNNGKVNIDLDVLAKYAGLAAIECFGIVGMASVSVRDGITKLLKREKLSKGIKVRVVDNEIYLDFHLIVAYGVSIETVADILKENVTYKMSDLTGMKIAGINIFVDGVRVID